MMKFFSGFLTGVIVILLVIGIGGYVLFAAVPLSTIEGMFGVDLTPGEENTNGDKSIYEMGQLLVGTMKNIQNTSFNDIKKNFGIDVLGIIKSKIGEDKDYTCLDGVMSAGLGNVYNEVMKIKTGDIMGLVGVGFDENLKDMMSPMLNASIKEVTDNTKTIFDGVINGIKVINLRNIDPQMLPDIPLFSEANNDKLLVDILKGFAENSDKPIVLGDVLNIGATSPKIMQALKDKEIMKLADAMNTLTLGEIIDIDTSSSKLLQNLAGETLSTLGTNIDSKIKELKISDIMETPEGSMLFEVKDATLTNIQDEMIKVVKTATMYKLESWGMITNVDLEKTIGGVKLGNMTIENILVYINSLPST